MRDNGLTDSNRDTVPSLSDRIISVLTPRGHRSKTAPEIAEALGIGQAERDSKSVFSETLERMCREGRLVRLRRGEFSAVEFSDFETGIVRLRSDGTGRIETSAAGPALLFVPRGETLGAMDGDRVLVRRIAGAAKSRGPARRPPERSAMPAGMKPVAVVDVLERARSRIVGIYRETDRGPVIRPDDLRVVDDIAVEPVPGDPTPLDGQYVELRISRFPSSSLPAAGSVTRVIGFADEPGVDAEVALLKFGIPVEFPPGAESEASSFGRIVPPEAYAGRLDLRGESVVTIDGETAKDFDDAVSATVIGRGRIRLGVHIADVGYYVKEGSSLDEAAKLRGTSVYFPGRCIPMLPEALSNGLCSLVPDEDRLTLSVFMEIDESGRVERTEFARSVIRSAARCTYTKVAAALGGDSPARGSLSHVLETIERLNEVASRIGRRRTARGSIDFDLPDADLLLDEFGAVVGIVPEQRNTAHRLIEELMIAANEAVARALSEDEYASLYRVHEPPDPLDLLDLAETLSGFGLKLEPVDEQVPPAEFQKILVAIRDRPEERFLRDLLLRSQRKALYDVECKGHYALAAPDYCHFTSPIRRYPDLVAHRAMVRRLERRPAGSVEEADRVAGLREITPRCNQTERRAESAEREVSMRMKLSFLKGRIGEEARGLVSGVTPFGVFVLLDEVLVEGMVHISNLPGDYYEYDEKKHLLRGRATGRRYRTGDAVDVRLFRIDPDRRRLELLPLGEPAVRVPRPTSRPKGASGARPGRSRRKS